MARNPQAFENAKENEIETSVETTATEATEVVETVVQQEQKPVDLSKLTAAQRIAYQAALAKGAINADGSAKEKKAKDGKAASERKVIMVIDPENGQPIARTDLIRRLWKEDKLSRSDITTVLNSPEVSPRNEKGEWTKIPYQIVFAAVKGIPGGPDATSVENTNASSEATGTSLPDANEPSEPVAA
jgi:hypothetical protein